MTPGSAFEDDDPIDRVVDVTSSDLIAIQSFYQRRVQDDAARDDSAEQQLWGFTADSSLPVSAARAELEYSVRMPQGDEQEGFAEQQNRLIRLRLNDHHSVFDYGADFFMVGQAFAANPLARERLNAVGLAGPGDGSEFWVAGHLPLSPRFRRLEKSQNGANLVNETFGLSYGHSIAGAGYLQYLLESSKSATWFDDAVGADHDRLTTAGTLQMSSRDWSVFLKNAHFDDQFDSGTSESGWSWQFGGTMNLFSGLALSPQVTGQIRDVGTDDYLRDTTERLTLHTTLIDPLALDVQWQWDRRDTLDGGTLESTAANVKLRAPLRFGERLPPGLVMTASVGFRGMQGVAAPSPQEGMSFQLTLDYQPARGSR